MNYDIWVHGTYTEESDIFLLENLSFLFFFWSMIQYIGLAPMAHRLSSFYISVINIAFSNKTSCNVNNHLSVNVQPSTISFYS